jgi:hypothetical protein
MEEKTFRLPAVAGVLEKSYVEARLHTDGTANIDRILDLQSELTQSVATPYYVILDPDTGETRAKLEGAQADRFLGFLESGLEAAEGDVEP